MKTIVNYAQLVKQQHALNISLAPVEADPTASSKAYAIGQHFILDGKLYKAKTAIALGDALVLDTNYEAAGSIEAQIETLDAENQTLTNEVDKIANGLSDQVDAHYLKNKNLWSYGSRGFQVWTEINVDIPSGTYTLLADVVSNDTDASNCLILAFYDDNSTLEAYINRGNSQSVTFTATNHVNRVRLYASNNFNNSQGDTAAFTNIMLSTEGGAFVPYVPSNAELLSADTNAVLGAHNWVPIKLSRIKALNTTGTWNNNVYSINNLTVTFNDDLSISVSGTASENTEIQLCDMFSLPAGVDFVMEGTPASGGVNKYWWYLKNRTPSDTSVKNMNPTESGNVLHFTVDATNHYYRAQLYIWASQATSVTFYPLIHLASDPSTTYAPYAMTNRELTEILSDVGTYNVPVIMGSAQNSYVRGAIPYHDKTAKHTVTINSIKQFADSTDYTSQFSVDYSNAGFAIIYSGTVALAGALMNVNVTVS